ncbi:hypothetical protein [Photobacterium leiognathi]|uniref:hypothetical protein n=1 Tax=Photobacterium leiognathi TaxID=553611 RepID=UPI000A8ED546|nr:hypothetical protein [Photobacterium leiognathi]
MASKESYQVAIDILRCHLGMSLEEAHKELGIDQPGTTSATETQELLIGLTQDS